MNLSSAGIVKFDEMEQTVTPLPESNIMTRSMIKFETMKLLMSLDPQCGIEMVHKVCTYTKIF